MFLIASSARCFSGPDFCLIFAPCGYDDPEILPSRKPLIRLNGGANLRCSNSILDKSTYEQVFNGQHPVMKWA
jgi:hypothetical protein